MYYNPELGMQGNLEKSLRQNQLHSNEIFDERNKRSAIESVTDTMIGAYKTTNKSQAAEQLRRALQMFARTLSDDEAMEVAMVYPAYAVGTAYQVGDLLTFGTNGVGDPQLYRVVQAHTAQEDWEPDKTPALYSPIGLTEEGYPVWSQPTGTHDAYNIDDIVEFEGKLYKSTVGGNVWAPNVYGWEEVTE